MLGCWSILGLPVVMMGGEKANPKLMAESPLFRRMGSCSAGQGKWPHPTSSRKPCLGFVGPRPLRFPKYRPGPFPARGPPGAPTVLALPPPSCPFPWGGRSERVGGRGQTGRPDPTLPAPIRFLPAPGWTSVLGRALVGPSFHLHHHRRGHLGAESATRAPFLAPRMAAGGLLARALRLYRRPAGRPRGYILPGVLINRFSNCPD